MKFLSIFVVLTLLVQVWLQLQIIQDQYKRNIFVTKNTPTHFVNIAVLLGTAKVFVVTNFALKIMSILETF